MILSVYKLYTIDCTPLQGKGHRRCIVGARTTGVMLLSGTATIQLIVKSGETKHSMRVPAF